MFIDSYVYCFNFSRVQPVQYQGRDSHYWYRVLINEYLLVTTYTSHRGLLCDTGRLASSELRGHHLSWG